MNTKIIMTASALFLGLTGLGLSFLPNELIDYIGITSNPILTILLQLLGALYLGFGMMNWMGKGSIIGGVYNKPMTIGNFMHFGVGALALVKVAFGIQENIQTIIALTIVYAIFAIAFAYIFMANPSRLKS